MARASLSVSMDNLSAGLDATREEFTIESIVGIHLIIRHYNSCVKFL
jgi:hypothetical protein